MTDRMDKNNCAGVGDRVRGQYFRPAERIPGMGLLGRNIAVIGSDIKQFRYSVMRSAP